MGGLARYQQNKQFGQEWQSQGVAVHRANMSNRRTEIKRSLRCALFGMHMNAGWGARACE